MDLKEFFYASKEEQLKRANRFLIIGYLVFFLAILVLMWSFYLRGIRSLQLSTITTIFLIAAAATTLFLGRIRKDSPRLKYCILPMLITISMLISFSFTQESVFFLGAFPLVGGILFFDNKYTRISCLSYAVMTLVVCIIKSVTRSNLPNGSAVDEIFAMLAVDLLLFLIIMTTRVASVFNRDSLGASEREKENIKEVMDSVMKVAAKVRTGTENVMGIVNDLNDSTEVMNGAMNDISDSAQSTAENIQVQTTMTGNIQDAIGQTIEISEEMVKVAKRSESINTESMEVMQHLKNQSSVITETSMDVANAMKELQERTEAVKTIANTIFGISNQTNLLALNASIESARAGEAGRGFAVVADEIRQLAGKTRQETERIAAISDELTQTANAAANAVARATDATNVQEEMIAKASESFELINDNVSELITKIDSIDGMLSSLSEANNQIVDNITNLSATTEEVTASSSQAAELSYKNLENAELAKNELNNVLEVSHQLDKYLS